MDRDKLKSTGEAHRMRAPRSGRGGKESEATTVAAALGAPATVVIDGESVEVKLTLRDLALMERDWNTSDAFFGALNEGRARALEYFLWLQVRRTRPGITAEEAGELVDVRHLEALQQELLQGAGLTEDPEGNAAAAVP